MARLELTEMTQKLLAKYCDEHPGADPRAVLTQALEQFFEKSKPCSEERSVEFELVTLRVPKKIMEYLRMMEKANSETPTEYLEYSLVDVVRAELQAQTGKELCDLFDLNPIFKALVNDEVS
jgi:hypothetical protein